MIRTKSSTRKRKETEMTNSPSLARSLTILSETKPQKDKDDGWWMMMIGLDLDGSRKMMEEGKKSSPIIQSSNQSPERLDPHARHPPSSIHHQFIINWSSPPLRKTKVHRQKRRQSLLFPRYLVGLSHVRNNVTSCSTIIGQYSILNTQYSVLCTQYYHSPR